MDPDPEEPGEILVTTTTAMTLARKLRSYLQSSGDFDLLDGLCKIENRLVKHKLESKTKKQTIIQTWFTPKNRQNAKFKRQ